MMKILVAEDDATMRQLLSTLLSRRNIPCSLVADGRSAVEAWENGEYQVILMDVQMPDLDGLEATRIIRQKERDRGGHVAIIAMTAHAMAKDRNQCLQSGMDDYISKPIIFNELLSLISRYAQARQE
ncbi:response regulator [Geobacter sp. SVR]|uniref:response regulator n=1 Tax=Geobacter sp. SVR TaxID=2495594 RepID=UPI001EF30820|nr:response regulator [Geobacter sp. SVR]